MKTHTSNVSRTREEQLESELKELKQFIANSPIIQIGEIEKELKTTAKHVKALLSKLEKLTEETSGFEEIDANSYLIDLFDIYIHNKSSPYSL